MHRVRILFLFLLFVTPLTAPAQEWRRAPEYDVLLSSYDIEPQMIRLKAGEPVRLRFVNTSNQTHDFSAPSFFATAQLRRRDRQMLADGRLTVGPGQARTVALVPRFGRYRMKSGNLLRRFMGMNGIIVVE